MSRVSRVNVVQFVVEGSAALREELGPAIFRAIFPDYLCVLRWQPHMIVRSMRHTYIQPEELSNFGTLVRIMLGKLGGETSRHYEVSAATLQGQPPTALPRHQLQALSAARRRARAPARCELL